MDTKKLEEFTQKVKAGDITDFEPWFDEKDQETLQTFFEKIKIEVKRYGKEKN